jgi:hypothetical protein
MSGDAGEAAAQVLVEHRRVPTGADTVSACTCGWRSTDTGVTHAAHVIHALQMAGLDVVWR